MAKILDITDKLNFSGKPKLKIKDIEIEVNNDAMSMLKIFPKMSKHTNPSDVNFIYETLFNESERKKVEKLNLSFGDFSTFVENAVSIAADNGEEDTGEALTSATT